MSMLESFTGANAEKVVQFCDGVWVRSRQQRNTLEIILISWNYHRTNVMSTLLLITSNHGGEGQSFGGSSENRALDWRDSGRSLQEFAECGPQEL